VALLKLGTGATIGEAALAAGVSRRSVDMFVSEHGRMNTRETKQRPDALTFQDREEIRVGIERKESNPQIARRIGKHRGTVWREITNNGGRDAYRAVRANNRADECARRPRDTWVEKRWWLFDIVVDHMKTDAWSPEQIARRLHKEHPDDASWWVSHETIYQAIYVQARGELRKELLTCLRSGRTRRKLQGRKARSDRKIRDMVMISDRPPEVEDRAVPGHWEGDLIIGKGSRSQVGTIVERTTRYGRLIKLDTKAAEHVAEHLAHEMERLPVELAKTLTWDQGTELADHVNFTVKTGIDVFFCDPHSPWQRGTNENWNGLVRQFLPKGIDLSGYSQDDLDEISRLLNNRPRKTLDWDKPAERYNLLVATTT
jgi:IS30 family transposase